MKNAIVTGATGFIGSWLMERLLQENVQVTALVVEGVERIPAWVQEQISLVLYDPKHISHVGAKLAGPYDAFFNLGWAGVSPENKNNIHLQLDNIRCAMDAISFAQEVGCRRFIGVGTVAEYVYCSNAISEDVPPSPADLYGAAKVSTHFLSQVLANEMGIDFNWVIVPSTFGERRTDNNLISYTIRTLLDGKKPSYTGLEQMWDFLYIADVVRALHLIADRGTPGKMYGIGSGVYRPLKEYISEIRDLIDPSLPLGIGDRPYLNNRISSSCVDNSELVMDTGFKPQITFIQGITNTIRYFREVTG